MVCWMELAELKALDEACLALSICSLRKLASCASRTSLALSKPGVVALPFINTLPASMPSWT